jgi:hypothetical protein
MLNYHYQLLCYLHVHVHVHVHAHVHVKVHVHVHVHVRVHIDEFSERVGQSEQVCFKMGLKTNL